ncbi:MAG: SIMPL domain-containing protein [Dehalococcoidia bacterium]|jgi:uncharacterized protein YggE
MKKFLVAGGMVLISLALVLSLVGFSACSAGPTTIGTVDVNNQQEGIWVSGQGEVSVVPDLATLYLGVEAQAETVADAQDQAAAAMDAVMDALENSGVDEDDIQTQYFSIDEVTRWTDDEPVVTGYRVSNMVTAKIRDMEAIGDILDAVADAGGDLTRVSNIAFSVEDPTEYYAEARDEAMADALAKAEQLAELAGVELGAPTYISEGTIYSPVNYRDAAGSAVPTAEGLKTSISPGELELSLSVQVAYAIEG